MTQYPLQNFTFITDRVNKGKCCGTTVEGLSLMFWDFSKYSQAMHSLNLFLECLVDQLMLLNSPFAFELTGFYMDLVHGSTSTWYIHNFERWGWRELLLQDLCDADLSVCLRGQTSLQLARSNNLIAAKNAESRDHSAGQAPITSNHCENGGSVFIMGRL